MEHDTQDPLYGFKGGPVIIEDYDWISSRVIVMPDVTVGTGAVVAAGAVVPKDVAPISAVFFDPCGFNLRSSWAI